jgi:hypothetical protein
MTSNMGKKERKKTIPDLNCKAGSWGSLESGSDGRVGGGTGHTFYSHMAWLQICLRHFVAIDLDQGTEPL